MIDAAFDEGLFPLLPRLRADYERLVVHGLERMSRLRVAIGGLTRNSAQILPKTIARIEQLGSLFGDYQVIIYENDSHDDTPRLLAEWSARNTKAQTVSAQLLDPINPQTRDLARAARMASYRNQLRTWLLAIQPAVSHIIMLDTDLNGGWSYNGVAHTFGLTQPWDFVGSNGIVFKNQRPLYFDVWAFRRQGSYRPLPSKEVNPLHWPKGSPLVPVYSCFGGLGVYRREALEHASYDGSDCEHVPLHRKMRENGFGRQFMNPSQITLY